MKIPILKEQLADLYAYKESRVRLGNKFVQENAVKKLVGYCEPSSGVSHQACWCLEQVYLLHEQDCHPHLKKIFKLFAQPINTSGRRSLLKIGFEAAKSLYSRKQHPIQNLLNEKMKEQLIKFCFESLLKDSGKSANLMFATRTLYLMRTEHELIPEQLPALIERHMLHSENKGYRSCGREILAKLSLQRKSS